MHGSTLAKFRVRFNILEMMAVALFALISLPLTSRTISAQESAGAGCPIGISFEPATNPRPNPGPDYRSAQEIYFGGLRMASWPLDGSVGTANRRAGLDSSPGRHDVRDFSRNRE